MSNNIVFILSATKHSDVLCNVTGQTFTKEPTELEGFSISPSEYIVKTPIELTELIQSGQFFGYSIAMCYMVDTEGPHTQEWEIIRDLIQHGYP